MYHLQQVDGIGAAEVIRYLNSFEPSIFPALSDLHLQSGKWWFVRSDNREIVGFGGYVPMTPFPGVAYLKRAYIVPAHRGNGLQRLLLEARQTSAREDGYHLLVSECVAGSASEANFRKAGFEQTHPEQPWGAPNATYWVKQI